ncbi:MAG: hypothetical protein ACOY71_04400 [Gemmatimonadota bacterium]
MATAFGWFVLLVLGEAAALALTEAGPVVRYQHLLPLPRLWAEAPRWALAVVLVQLTAVAFALRRKRSRLPVRGWRLGAIVAAFVLTSATLSRQPLVYGGELALASLLQALALACVWLAVTAIPPDIAAGWDARLGPLLEGPVEAGPDPLARPGRFELIAAACVTLIAALLAVLVYDRHPHIPDEVVYLLHARYFAAGRLWLAAPPVPGAFDVDLMLLDGSRWMSPVPPGWPAVLALGVLAGAPWLVNPLLSGLNVVLGSVFLRQIFPARTARLGAVLLCASPWHLFMGMTYLTHPASLAFALLAAIATARWRATGKPLWTLIAGVGVGAVSLVRPLEGVILAGLAGLWAVWLPGWRRRITAALGMGLATATIGGLQLAYNARITGSATRFPLMTYVDRTYHPGANDLGFGPNRGLGWSGLDPLPGHGLPDVLINANFNLFALNTELLGWACGSILPLALAVFARRRAVAGDRLMGVTILAVIGAHSFYWFSGGPDFGPRYWYLLIVPAIALAARGVETARETLEHRPERIRLAAVLLIVLALTAFVPWRAGDKYQHYRGMRADLRRLAAAQRWDSGTLVLVRGKRHPDYASAAAYLPLDLAAGGPVYAWARSAETADSVLRAYPHRRVWLVDGPSLTDGAGYVVRSGPLAPTEAERRVPAWLQ